MKRLLIIVLLVITCNAFSQPVITATNHLPAFGDWYQVSTLTEIYNITPGRGGENQVWDFGNLPQSMLSPTVATFIDPAGTPHINDVPGCNLAIYGGDDFYQYLKTSASGYEWSTVFINGNFAIYTDPFTVFEFPFTYGNEFTDTYDYTIVAGEMSSRLYGTQLTTSDGYGTLTTPIGTFENVLRVVRKSENHSFTTAPGFSWSYSDSTYEYQWYAPGITYPLVSFTTWPNTSVDTFDVIYISNYKLTTDFKKVSAIDEIQIYPNPVKDKMVLVSDESWEKVSLFDLSGRIVSFWANNSLSGRKTTFDLSALKNGIYLLKVETISGKNEIRKIIIQ